MTQSLITDDERAPNERPVAVVASRLLSVETLAGGGTVPVFANGDWLAPTCDVKRAVILIHGRLRNAMRPTASGKFEAFDATACPLFNRWKYGLEDLPAYASSRGSTGSADALESRYARREVTVLLGGADCDPEHPALDRSCAAQTQGEHRLERGLAYARYMASRHPEGTAKHRTFVIDGVGHEACCCANVICEPPFEGLRRHEQDPTPRRRDRRCIAECVAAEQRECRRCA
ncbi:hypothetical protein [Paraburkholderia sp.]|uniref:hypothetical protein n=1 Tax=Paraburkholderia sp. TaxID=1926495 RepID=UPI002D6AA8FB|nr:hypothetical protein [Paraburkholderia sp.]HZZ06205.1 hypothetical protein [Paraburkholderia sp.]